MGLGLAGVAPVLVLFLVLVLVLVLVLSAAWAVLPAGTASAAVSVRASAGIPGQARAAGPDSIPAQYLRWYQAATRTCPGLAWEVLAGIGTVESDNGRSNARGVHRGKNRMGAEGPMQFERATFAEYAVRADRSARVSPYDPQDAIFTAARMLCADGAASGSACGMRGAIFAYNHAHWYVRDVLALAAQYTAEVAAATAPARGNRRRAQPGWVHGY